MDTRLATELSTPIQSATEQRKKDRAEQRYRHRELSPSDPPRTNQVPCSGRAPPETNKFVVDLLSVFLFHIKNDVVHVGHTSVVSFLER